MFHEGAWKRGESLFLGCDKAGLGGSFSILTDLYKIEELALLCGLR